MQAVCHLGCQWGQDGMGMVQDTNSGCGGVRCVHVSGSLEIKVTSSSPFP